MVRGLFYDKDGKLLKDLVTGNIKLLDAKNKRYRPMHMEMINKQNGRRSVFDSSKVTFAPNTKDVLHDRVPRTQLASGPVGPLTLALSPLRGARGRRI